MLQLVMPFGPDGWVWEGLGDPQGRVKEIERRRTGRGPSPEPESEIIDEGDVVDKHPHGELCIMQSGVRDDSRAWVVRCQSGEVVWGPPWIVTMCWRDSGRELLAITLEHNLSGPERSWDKAPLGVFREDVRTQLRRLTWPELRETARVPIEEENLAWWDRIVASSALEVAALQWNHEDAAGISIVGLAGGRILHEKPAIFRTEEHYVGAIVQSPDGKRLFVYLEPHERLDRRASKPTRIVRGEDGRRRFQVMNDEGNWEDQSILRRYASAREYSGPVSYAVIEFLDKKADIRAIPGMERVREQVSLERIGFQDARTVRVEFSGRQPISFRV